MGVNKVILGNENIIDISDSSVSTSNLLQNETAYDASGTKITGQMTNNGAMSGSILTPSQSIVIPSGYHNGNGSVSIDSTEAAKITAGNIKKGVTILGVTGDTCVDTSDGNATTWQILKNKKAYVNGNKVTGSSRFTPAVDSVNFCLGIDYTPPTSSSQMLYPQSDFIFKKSDLNFYVGELDITNLYWSSSNAKNVNTYSIYVYGCNSNSLTSSDWTSLWSTTYTVPTSGTSGNTNIGKYFSFSKYTSYTWYKLRLVQGMNKYVSTRAAAILYFYFD